MIEHRAVFNEDQRLFRDSVRRFMDTEIAPNFPQWEKTELVDRSLWTKAGEAGLLCPQVPEQYGGIGGDFRFNAVLIEECSYAGYAGPTGNFTAHSDVSCGYLLSYGSQEIKEKWLPKMVSGEAVCSIAMVNPRREATYRALKQKPWTTAIITSCRAPKPLSQMASTVILPSWWLKPMLKQDQKA